MNLAEETTCDGSAGQPDASDTAVQDKSTPPSVTSSHQCKKHRRRLHTSNDVTHRNKRDDVGPEVKTSPRMTSSTHRYASFRVADILSRDSTSASQYKPGNSLTSHSWVWKKTWKVQNIHKLKLKTFVYVISISAGKMHSYNISQSITYTRGWVCRIKLLEALRHTLIFSKMARNITNQMREGGCQKWTFSCYRPIICGRPLKSLMGPSFQIGLWQNLADCSSSYASIDRVGFLIWRHI